MRCTIVLLGLFSAACSLDTFGTSDGGPVAEGGPFAALPPPLDLLLGDAGDPPSDAGDLSDAKDASGDAAACDPKMGADLAAGCFDAGSYYCEDDASCSSNPTCTKFFECEGISDCGGTGACCLNTYPAAPLTDASCGQAIVSSKFAGLCSQYCNATFQLCRTSGECVSGTCQPTLLTGRYVGICR